MGNTPDFSALTALATNAVAGLTAVGTASATVMAASLGIFFLYRVFRGVKSASK